MLETNVSCQDKYALKAKKKIIGPLLTSHWLNHAYMSPHTRYFMLSGFFCNYLEGLLLDFKLIRNYIQTLVTEENPAWVSREKKVQKRPIGAISSDSMRPVRNKVQYR